MSAKSVQVAATEAQETALETLQRAPAWSLKAAQDLAARTPARTSIPVRRTFVNAGETGGRAPLAELVARRGRGGVVPLKLYLALIWRCSAPPFSTDIQARLWATLLGLPEPDTHGARRIANALDVLEAMNLVSLERRRGESTVITLLEESGTGEPYSLPSGPNTSGYTYFKVPIELWTVEGDIQVMSAAGVAMLLALLEGRNLDGEPTWWSTERFPARYGLTPTIRSRGTSELVERTLLFVNKRAVSKTSGFSSQRVRNTYQLLGRAVPREKAAAKAPQQSNGSPSKAPVGSHRVTKTTYRGKTSVSVSGFTAGENQVLVRLGEGLTNREIAAAMGVSENVVRNLVSGVLSKLHVQRRTQAALIAAQLGIVPPD